MPFQWKLARRAHRLAKEALELGQLDALASLHRMVRRLSNCSRRLPSWLAPSETQAARKH